METRLAALSPEKRRVLEALLAERSAKATGQAAYRAPESRAEQQLVAIWEAVLGRTRVGVDDNFFALGGDSIHCIQVVARARDAGLNLSNQLVFANPTIAALAALQPQASPEVLPQALCAGPVALAPIQRWFFRLNLQIPQHWNQAVLLDVLQPVSLQRLQDALMAVTLHHDALRLRFAQTPEGWVQQAGIDDALPSIREAHLVNDAELCTTVASAQTGFHLEHGPLFAALLLHGPVEDSDAQQRYVSRLLLTAHHLLVDAVSFRILLQDLERVLQRSIGGQPYSLPAKTASYTMWSAAWQSAALIETPEQEAFWQAQLAVSGRVPLECAGDRSGNIEQSAASVTVTLLVSETTRLQQESNTPLFEALLRAVGATLTEWAGTEELRIDAEGHGRDALPAGLDVSRTVGWFTSIYPLRISSAGRVDPARQVPHGGSRYLNRTTPQTAGADAADAMLNYLGSFAGNEASSLFRLSSDADDLWVFGGENLRPHVLQIVAGIWGGQLRLEWRYSRALHHESTIQGLAEQCLRHLQTPAAQTTAVFGRVTPEDLRVLASALQTSSVSGRGEA